MTAPYVVDVDVAGLTWSIAGPAGPVDPTAPPELGPIAPLTIGHALPDDQLVPAQPQPRVATFGIAAAAWDDVAGVVAGADCHLTYTAAGGATVTFDGNVSDVTVTPARIRDPETKQVTHGVIIGVVAVGYLAQLWEESVTLAEDTWAFAEERLVDLFAETPWPAPTSPIDPGTNDSTPLFKAMKVEGDALGPILDRLLRLWVWKSNDDPNGPKKRTIIEAQLGPDRKLDPVTPWRLVAVPATQTAGRVATFDATADGWGVVVDPAAAGVIDAGRVDRGISFVQRKGTTVTKVIVPYTQDGDPSGKKRSITRSNGDTPTVRHELDSDLHVMFVTPDRDWPERAAEFYLPPAGADRWGVDAVTWRLYADEPGSVPPPVGSVVTFAPVPETSNPNRRSWISGLVSAWQLNVTAGRPTIDLTLRTPSLTDPDDVDALTWDQLPDGVTWDQLHPDHTWNDYALLGGTT